MDGLMDTYIHACVRAYIHTSIHQQLVIGRHRCLAQRVVLSVCLIHASLTVGSSKEEVKRYQCKQTLHRNKLIHNCEI